MHKAKKERAEGRDDAHEAVPTGFSLTVQWPRAEGVSMPRQYTLNQILSALLLDVNTPELHDVAESTPMSVEISVDRNGVTMRSGTYLESKKGSR